MYEMLAGFPPFYDDNPFGIYEKILSGKIEWPKHIDPVAKDLIKKLLVQDRTKRLGNMKVCLFLILFQIIYSSLKLNVRRSFQNHFTHFQSIS